MLRRTILTILFFALSTVALHSCPAAASPNLPDLVGWETAGARFSAPLDTVSGNQGYWEFRTYRSAAGTAYVTLMQGKGVKVATPSVPIQKSNDGMLGAGATYSGIVLDDQAIVVECHPVLGTSLSVFLPDGVLTIESGNYGLTEENLTALAQTILAAMHP